MKANIRFFLPLTAVNKEVKENGRIDFQCDAKGVGMQQFQNVVASMGGGVYTLANMEQTNKDYEVDRLLSVVERGIESNGDQFDDEDDYQQEATNALDELRELLR
jgi:hypothetical protein